MNFTLETQPFSSTKQTPIEIIQNSSELLNDEDETSELVVMEKEKQEEEYLKFEKLLSLSSNSSDSEEYNRQETEDKDGPINSLIERGEHSEEQEVEYFRARLTEIKNSKLFETDHSNIGQLEFESPKKSKPHFFSEESPNPSEYLLLNRKKTILEEVEMEEDCRIYKNRGWPKTKLMLISNRIAFFEFTLTIKEINKIKILPSNINQRKAENIIKMQAGSNVQLFSVTMDKKNYSVPTSFCVFAKIIEKKLKFGNYTLDDAWQKSEHLENYVTEDSFIYGTILKKSQILGNWESRFIVVKKDGIYSYLDNRTSKTFSFEISASTIKYLWTRFDIHNNYLIVKIKHGLLKTEFAIPITSFSVREPRNWLYSFYRIIPNSL